jgi:hypothetical protein
MYLDSLATNDVEGEIEFDDQDTITVFPKFGMSRYSSKERMVLKLSDAFIKSVNK